MDIEIKISFFVEPNTTEEKSHDYCTILWN